MNERIKQLMLEAEHGNFGRIEFAENFAELIVEEFLLKAKGAKIRGESIDELIQRIKEDFGVEE